ncbi:MAG: hypothetical protein ACJ78M_13330 [Gemmatimonadaceae bacterium]
MSAAPWIAAYVATLAVWFFFLHSDRAPTLWKGRSLLILNAAFVAVSVTVMMIRRQRPDLVLLVFDVVLLATGIFVRNVWVLLNIERAELNQVLEKCFVRTRAQHQPTPTGYLVRVGGTEMGVMLSSAARSTLRLRFTGAHESKKAGLIQALIGKQFRPSFPTLRIRT